MITNNLKISHSSKATIFRVLRQIAYTKLYKKYSSGDFSYHKILANNLVFNDTCRIVARFKDYLILDDNTEFLRRFYDSEECNPRLNRILIFYETYSKIFPNYMILKESKYLYRNIRKKQKMIDAVNEIKREEEENRKKMKQKSDKNNNFKNELFTKKVKEEIKTFQENTTFQKYKNNNFDSDNDNENSISISVINKKMFENMEINFNSNKEIGRDRNNSVLESFVTNETNHSISGILNMLNDNKIYIKDLPKLLEINNYSKNSLKIKKINKPNRERHETDKKINIHKPKGKQNKKNDLFSRQYQLNKNTLPNTSNINNNYIKTKGEIKKLSMLSTLPGAVLTSNTEKNFNEINQYQNIIIPKGSTVININNNYFEHQTPTSSILQMGYYTNKNFKINKNNNESNNYKSSSTLEKSNTIKNNNYIKNNNNIQKRAKKNNSKNLVKKINNEDKENFVYRSKNNKILSQDFIYQKFNKNAEVKSIEEKLTKFNSLSPTPNNNRFEQKYHNKKIINNYLKTEKAIHTKNYLTENNNLNLITGITQTNDNEDNERNRFLIHIRDLIENNKKNNDEFKGKSLYNIEEKNNNINNKNHPKLKNFNFNIFSKYKTISNFKAENKDNSNILKTENRYLLGEKCFSKKDILSSNQSLSKEKKRIESNDKTTNYKKIHIKNKNNKIKGYIKSNQINSNYNSNHQTNIKTNTEKNKDFFKTNNNFKNHKNLFDNMIYENSSKKSIEKHVKKNNRLLKLNNQALKTEKKEKNNFNEKEIMAITPSTIYNKNTSNHQFSNLLTSYKKENQFFTESNNHPIKKIYHKGKIKKMKYKKDNLNLDYMTKTNSINSICYSNSNNFYTEYNNKSKKNLKTDKMNNNMNSNEINSELRNRYKNFLLKKNRIKSCEFDKQSETYNNSKELIDRMTFLKQNKAHNIYQNFLENKPIYGNKSNRANNFGLIDISNANLNQTKNSKGKNGNYLSEKNVFKTPLVENKRIRLYKKVINKKLHLTKTEKKPSNNKIKNFITPATIKVNRSKFLENVKNKIFDNNYKIETKK